MIKMTDENKEQIFLPFLYYLQLNGLQKINFYT